MFQYLCILRCWLLAVGDEWSNVLTRICQNILMRIKKGSSELKITPNFNSVMLKIVGFRKGWFGFLKLCVSLTQNQCQKKGRSCIFKSCGQCYGKNTLFSFLRFRQINCIMALLFYSWIWGPYNFAYFSLKYIFVYFRHKNCIWTCFRFFFPAYYRNFSKILVVDFKQFFVTQFAKLKKCH